MKDNILTDIQVENEIKRLNANDYVKLYRKAKQIKERRKQYLYQLRWMEKQGIQLAKEGYTMDNLEEMLADAESGEESD